MARSSPIREFALALLFLGAALPAGAAGDGRECSPYAAGSGFEIQDDGRVRVGDIDIVDVQTPHPYPAGDANRPVVWSHTFSRPGASFLKLHLAEVELAPGDRVELRDGRGELRESIDAGAAGDVWCGLVFGDRLTLSLRAGPTGGAWGLRVDRLGSGYPLAVDGALAEALGDEAPLTCDYLPASCGTGPQRNRADAVGALFIADQSPGGGQMSFCTGFQIEPGRFLTSYHCAPALLQCDNADVFFGYDVACDQTCNGGSRDTLECCPGGLCQDGICDDGPRFGQACCPGGTCDSAAGADLPVDGPYACTGISTGPLSVNTDLDYAILDLDASPPHTTIQLSAAVSPVLDQELYLIGNPGGGRKRISRLPEDPSCEVTNDDIAPCGPPGSCLLCGSGRRLDSYFYYSCNTQGGSSGSPVLDASGHALVGLHKGSQPAISDCSAKCGVQAALIAEDLALDIPALAPWGIPVLVVSLCGVALRAARRRETRAD